MANNTQHYALWPPFNAAAFGGNWLEENLGIDVLFTRSRRFKHPSQDKRQPYSGTASQWALFQYREYN